MDEGTVMVAISQSVEYGWVLAEHGPPHRIRLTDQGWAIARSAKTATPSDEG
jgi:hypothetical protein